MNVVTNLSDNYKITDTIRSFYREDTAFYRRIFCPGLKWVNTLFDSIIFAGKLKINAKAIRESIQIFYDRHPCSDLVRIVHDSLH
jgi:hypothetical protein